MMQLNYGPLLRLIFINLYHSILMINDVITLKLNNVHLVTFVHGLGDSFTGVRDLLSLDVYSV